MRTLCLCVLLLLAPTALAADDPSDEPASKTQPQWQRFRGPDGNLRSRAEVIDASRKSARESSPDSDTCYFIRSYVMHRDDDSEAMHLDRVTTCTPKPRLRMKSIIRVVPAVR